MYSLEEDIIHFIFLCFKGKKRKKEDVDLVFHSVIVGNMLKNIGCDDKTVYVGYLHDVLEDTDCTFEELSDKFGEELANKVMLLSEDKSISDYRKRKTEFIKKLKQCEDKSILYVELADKLHNLVSDYELWRKNGKDSLMTESDNFDNFQWYYLEFQKFFNEELKENQLLDRYNEIVSLYFDINKTLILKN